VEGRRGAGHARFRGWTAFIGLQIEYSLLERTVEGELVPMAHELGLGITPWSPLKSGILSGKYTRQNAGQLKSDRGAWADAHLTDKSYALLDELQHVAKQLDTSVARVAIAWVQGRPGVTSTIIGARTLAQLEDNLKALDVKLASEHVAKLDELTKPRSASPPSSRRSSRWCSTAAPHQRRVSAHRAVRAEPARRPLLVARPKVFR